MFLPQLPHPKELLKAQHRHRQRNQEQAGVQVLLNRQKEGPAVQVDQVQKRRNKMYQWILHIFYSKRNQQIAAT